MKIVSLGGFCLYPEHAAELRKMAEFVECDIAPDDEQAMIRRIEGADIIACAFRSITAPMIAASPHLKMICVAMTGCDSVDLAAAAQRNIVVCNVPAYATQAVAEHTFGLLLAAARKSFAAATDLRSGVYDPCGYEGVQLQGKTMGIVGMGRIGQRVADIAKHGFQMQVISYDTHSTRQDFEYLLHESDVISLHVPLLPTTRNMIGAQEFSLMKQDVMVVNTARGGIIDEQALLGALASGKVFAAGLDVLAEEPMKANNPLILHQRVVVSPHIAFNTKSAVYELSKMVLENIRNFIEGKPQNMVYVCP